MASSEKIFKIGDELPKIVSQKIVFTNGCFDLLHPGHLEYLKEASLLGDILIVGLNSDRSISKIKGNLRPINNFFFRSTMLSYFQFIDYIFEFDEDTPEGLIKSIKPNILVKGSDYFDQEIVGAHFVKSLGGEVVLISFSEGFSSSKIIDKIKMNP